MPFACVTKGAIYPCIRINPRLSYESLFNRFPESFKGKGKSISAPSCDIPRLVHVENLVEAALPDLKNPILVVSLCEAIGTELSLPIIFCRLV
jgi:hypothetical protein